jgi:O-antigen/teichoic acid export membrane protein
LLKPKINPAENSFFRHLKHSKTTFFSNYPLLNLMRGRFIHNLTANGLQLILNQGFGLLAFYLLVLNLSKQDFGQLNWILAVLLTSFGILGLGLDHVVVRKIAANEKPDQAFSIFIFHTIVTGIAFYLFLGITLLVIPANNASWAFLLLALGKMAFYFSSPFKQLAAGRERFKELLYMSVVSPAVKGIAIAVFALNGNLSFETAVLVYLFADVAEFIASIFIAKTKLSLKTDYQNIRRNYLSLLKHAWPQAGSVVFSAALNRIDWILVGILLSTTKLAEYSFAYRVFELTLLPLMIIGPVLLPWFSRKLSQGSNPVSNKTLVFLKTEIIMATILALLFCILWTPLMDMATNGRYGAVNQPVVFFLAATMPFLYVNNFLWTILFAEKKLKLIFKIIGLSLIINIAADIILIPLFQNAGAAAGFLIASVIQCILFLSCNPALARKMVVMIFLVPFTAAATLALAMTMELTWWVLLGISMTGFLFILYFFGFMRLRQFRFIGYVLTR